MAQGINGNPARGAEVRIRAQAVSVRAVAATSVGRHDASGAINGAQDVVSRVRQKDRVQCRREGDALGAPEPRCRARPIHEAPAGARAAARVVGHETHGRHEANGVVARVGHEHGAGVVEGHGDGVPEGRVRAQARHVASRPAAGEHGHDARGRDPADHVAGRVSDGRGAARRDGDARGQGKARVGPRAVRPLIRAAARQRRDVASGRNRSHARVALVGDEQGAARRRERDGSGVVKSGRRTRPVEPHGHAAARECVYITKCACATAR